MENVLIIACLIIPSTICFALVISIDHSTILFLKQSSCSCTSNVVADRETKETLLPKYEVIEFIGEGPLSEVYKARHRPDHHIVAIKILDKRLVIRKNKIKSVFYAKEAMLKLRECPGIVRLLETMQDEDTLYYVMEYATNGDLRNYVLEHEITEAQAKEITRNLFTAINYMHGKGIVHRYWIITSILYLRDIKPENILLNDKLEPLINDFECSYDLDAVDRELDFVGTPAYHNPHQINGTVTRENIMECDWWAFGCVLDFLFREHHLFHAPTEYLTMQKILDTTEIEFPPNTPEWAREIIETILLEQNYAKARELLKELL